MCSNGSQTYWPPLNSSSRAPMRGSASVMDENGLTVDRPADDVLARDDCGKVLLLEHFLAEALGVQRGVIQQRTHLGVTIAAPEHTQLLLGAIELAGEAEELEEKRAALGVGGVVPHLRTQRLYCVVQLSRLDRADERAFRT